MVLTTIILGPATNGFDDYKTYPSGSFSLPNGQQTITLDVQNGPFNLNWIEFRLDPCTGFDPAEIGTACDDGDASTRVDVFTAACECVGTPENLFVIIPSLVQAEDFVKWNPAGAFTNSPEDVDGSTAILNIGDDTWMEYALTVAEDADFEINFRASTESGGNDARVTVLNWNEEELVMVSFAGNGNFATYGDNISDPFFLAAGDYILRVDVQNSAFNLNSMDFLAITSLPIELTRFDATPRDKDISLDWATSSESNNAGFNLERGTGDGNFNSIAWIEGAGTSDVATQYTFTDTNVDVNTDYFYRLAQEDLDGKLTYSETVTGRLSKDVTDYNDLVKVYPNPAGNELAISLGNGSFDVPLENVRILNALGKVVLSGITDYRAIDLTSLPSGIYLISLEVEGEQVTRKIIKK